MNKFVWTITFVLLALTACDQKQGEEEAATAEASEAEETAAANDDGAKDSPAADSATTKGSFKFSVNGEKKSFGHLPAEKNMAVAGSTMLLALPESGSTEEFSILVTNFDVKKETLPAELNLDMKKRMQEKDPMKAMKAPNPIVQYVSPDGVQYRGFAEITFESFDGGVVKGKVGDMDLATVKPKDKEKPPIKLSGVSFEAKL